MTKEEALQKIKELETFIVNNGKSVPEIEMITVENLSTIPFTIGKYPVTQAQWIAVMGNNPSYFKGDTLPVESVNWMDAQEFIAALNTLTGEEYRLPTEHEWLICATIDGTLYSGSNNLDEVGWYGRNSNRMTHPVGFKKPNSLGIFDMSGNVWEWCEDLYKGNHSNRVLRGGSWYDGADYCRPALRNRNSPDYRYFNLGFRLAKTIK